MLPDTEYQHQKQFIAWLEQAYPRYRNCVRLSLNGVPLDRKSAPRIIAAAKKSGMVVGESDLFIAAPAHGFHGVFIEMKKPEGKANQKQLDYLTEMRGNGYAAEICCGAQEAIDFFDNYIAGNFGKRK